MLLPITGLSGVKLFVGVVITSIAGFSSLASEEIETYDSYEAAKKAMEGNAGWYRSVAEIIPDLIAVDTDTEFEDSKKALSMKIVKVQKE